MTSKCLLKSQEAPRGQAAQTNVAETLEELRQAREAAEGREAAAQRHKRRCTHAVAFGGILENVGDDGRNEQDDDKRVLELLEELLPPCGALIGVQLLPTGETMTTRAAIQVEPPTRLRLVEKGFSASVRKLPAPQFVRSTLHGLRCSLACRSGSGL